MPFPDIVNSIKVERKAHNITTISPLVPHFFFAVVRGENRRKIFR
jgi:hypothetical protein